MEIERDILIRLLEAVSNPETHSITDEYALVHCAYCWKSIFPGQKEINHEPDCVVLLAQRMLADLNTGFTDATESL